MKSINAIKSKYSSVIDSNLKKIAKKRRYPNNFKEEIVQLYHQGIKSSKLVMTFGISLSSLHEWRKHFKNIGINNGSQKSNKIFDEKSQPSFKEVQILESTEVFSDKGNFFLETPSGFKVKVSSQKTLVSIIRELEGFH